MPAFPAKSRSSSFGFRLLGVAGISTALIWLDVGKRRVCFGSEHCPSFGVQNCPRAQPRAEIPLFPRFASRGTMVASA